MRITRILKQNPFLMDYNGYMVEYLIHMIKKSSNLKSDRLKLYTASTVISTILIRIRSFKIQFDNSTHITTPKDTSEHEWQVVPELMFIVKKLVSTNIVLLTNLIPDLMLVLPQHLVGFDVQFLYLIFWLCIAIPLYRNT